MSYLEMLVVGTTVGVAHSFEADHLAAVASLVDEENAGRAGVIGTSWGIGHAIPIAAVGLLFLLAGTQLPASVAAAAELLAGVVLVLLGARILLGGVETTEHSHGGHAHTHFSLGPIDLGTAHSHRGGESFLVGIVHGLAGSGVAIGALATGATLSEGASLLGGFVVASIGTMGALALLWGSVLSTAASRTLQTIAGAAAIGIGLLLVARELVGVDLVGHEHPHDDSGHDHPHSGDGHEHAIEVPSALHEHAVDGGDLAVAVVAQYSDPIFVLAGGA